MLNPAAAQRRVRPRSSMEDDGSFSMPAGSRNVTSPGPGKHHSDVEDYAISGRTSVTSANGRTSVTSIARASITSTGRASVNSNNGLSFLPEITNAAKVGPRASQQGSQPQSQSTAPWTYGSPSGGAVEHWKKLAKKVELEKNLEEEHHRASRDKDYDAIQRLKSRVSALEAAVQEREMVIDKQRRKISFMKSQLGGANKRFGRELTPEPMRPDKSPKRSTKRPATTENENSLQGFDDFTIPKDDIQASVHDYIQMYAKKKQTKTTLAGKILQMRTENNLLQRQIGQRDERLKALNNEAEHLRRQLKDATASRNSAINQVKEIERLFEKLESMEPLIVKAGIISEHDINSGVEDAPTSPTKGRRTPDLEAFTTELDEANGKLTRKQAFRKWSNTLNKIRSALLTFVTKVHNTSQLEAHLKMEEESLSSFVKKLQSELTSQLDLHSLENTEEMDKIRGLEQPDIGKQVPRKSGMVPILDRDVMAKVVVAVREQGRKLELVTHRLEDLKKDKITLEASAFTRQKRVSDLERKVDQLRSEEDIFKCYIKHMGNMVASVDEPPFDEDDDRVDVNLPLGGDQDIQSLDKKINNKYKVHSLVRKLGYIMNESDEMKIEFRKLKSQFGGAWSELSNLRDCFSVLEISIDDESFNAEDVVIKLRHFKQRKDDLETFFEQANSCNKVMATDLGVLYRVLSEQNDPQADTLYGLEYIPKKLVHSSILGDQFIKAMSEFPDVIIKINHMVSVLSTYNAKSQKAESKRQELESRLLEQEKINQSFIESHRELELLKPMLEDICRTFIGVKPSADGSESLAITIKKHLQEVHTDIEIMSENNSINERELMDTKKIVLQAKALVQDLLKSSSGLKESFVEELQRDFKHNVITTGAPNFNSDRLLSDFIVDVKTCLEEVQLLRDTQKGCVTDSLSKLKQDLEAAKEIIQSHTKSMESSSNTLNEELSNLKAQKEAMSIELSNSAQEIKVLQFALKKYEDDSNAKFSELSNEIIRLQAEIEKYVQELSLLNSSKQELSHTIETLESKIQIMTNEHAGSLDSFEQLQANVKKLEGEKTSLEGMIESLKSTIKEKDTEIENFNQEIIKLNKEIASQAETIREHESGSGNLIGNLQSSLKEKEAEAENLMKKLERTKTLLDENEDVSKKTTETLKKEVELLQDKLKEKDKELKLQQEKQNEKEKELELLQDKQKENVKELESLQDKLKENEKALENIKTQETTEVKESSKELESLQDKLKENTKELESLQDKLKENTTELESLQDKLKESTKELESLQDKLKENAKEIETLKEQVTNKEKEIEVLKQESTTSIQTSVEEKERELTKLTNKISGLNDEIAKMTTSNEGKVKALEEEIVRLGGVSILDDTEKSKRLSAGEKIKDFLVKKLLPDVPRVLAPDSNPLKKLAIFEVDLLVNSKTQKRLETVGAFGGLTQAAIHYFSIDTQSGQITFGNGNQPGSQSSNMLAELMLSSGDDSPIYAATSNGDVLGLSVKVKGVNDRNSREILYNTNVIRTDEIMDAIRGQQIDNFSLWPDLVSCWKWEKSPKGWTLVSIKWRFLFKNIFPEISEALQNLTIKQGV